MRICDHSSTEQCQASTSGMGGTCARDPFYSNIALAYQPKQTRSRSKLRPAEQSAEPRPQRPHWPGAANRQKRLIACVVRGIVGAIAQRIAPNGTHENWRNTLSLFRPAR
jgi:hypothetical protein